MKVIVITHSGEEDIFEVDDFDPVEMTEMRNDREIDSICIGEASYARIDIKTVKPYVEKAE